MAPSSDKPFWKRKTLEELDSSEWEALCDGCGQCCMVVLEDEDTGERFQTRLSCKLLDIGSCRCGDYANRHAVVSDCVKLDAATVRRLDWLPDTCAYRLIAAGKNLPWWHPLVSGNPETVHQAGISVRGYARSEKGLKVKDYQRFIVE